MSVFISYRRDGGKQVAEDIFSSLNEEYNVFLDTESLKNGYFDTAIVQEIEKCSDFIVIITETVFNRCNQPNDWIFHEAQIALKEGKNIIPIFIGIKAFPENVPEPIKDICRFNGIFWSDKDSSCLKIRSFLTSNRRYVLYVERDKDRATLSLNSKNDLKEIYRRFLKYGRKSVDVQVKISDAKDLSSLIIRNDVVGGYGQEFAEHLAEQSLLKKYKLIHETLEIAIETMLQDEMLDACSLKLQKMYYDKYGSSECAFFDEDGIESYYWTPFLWIDIIDEMFKELLFDRYYVYGNSKLFTSLDCFVETRSGNEIWTFLSFIPQEPENDKYLQLMDKIGMPGGRGDYMDIPLCSLAHYVYPDLYYNIGLLKTNQTMQSYDSVNKYKDVFNLWHYYFGRH